MGIFDTFTKGPMDEMGRVLRERDPLPEKESVKKSDFFSSIPKGPMNELGRVMRESDEPAFKTFQKTLTRKPDIVEYTDTQWGKYKHTLDGETGETLMIHSPDGNVIFEKGVEIAPFSVGDVAIMVGSVGASVGGRLAVNAARRGIYKAARSYMGRHLRKVGETGKQISELSNEIAKGLQGPRLTYKQQIKMKHPEAKAIDEADTGFFQYYKDFENIPFYDDVADSLKHFDDFDRTLQNAERVLDWQRDYKIKGESLSDVLMRQWVAVDHHVRKELKKTPLGREAIIDRDACLGSSSLSDMYMKDADKIFFKTMPTQEYKNFNSYLFYARVKALGDKKIISKNGTLVETKFLHPGGVKAAEEAEVYLQTHTTPRMAQLLDKWKELTRKPIDDMLKKEIISQEEHTRLLNKAVYAPREILEYADSHVYKLARGSKTISVNSNGLEPLEEGTLKALELDSRRLLSTMYTRTYGLIARNEANKRLYDLAQAYPKNKIVKIWEDAAEDSLPTFKPGGIIEKPVPLSVDPNETAIHCVIKGKTHTMKMPNDMASAWILSDPQISANMRTGLSWALGGNILRPMATGWNPAFVLTNLPRDIVHAWFVSGQYSSMPLKFMGELAWDYIHVSKDAALRKGLYRQYVENGGGLPLLTHQGRLSFAHHSLHKTQEALGYIGETSELMTRLAVMRRAMRNGKTAREAAWIARNVLDFSQGGSWAKGIDVVCPYFNAAIQASRTMFRSMKDDPQGWMAKALWLGGMELGFNEASRRINPEAWNDLTPQEKNRLFIVTTGRTYIDKNGRTRHYYVGVPKPEFLRPYLTMLDGLYCRATGQAFDVDQAVSAAKDFLPIPRAPAVSALYGALANHDFWLDDDIWHGGSVQAKDEWTKHTHPFFKDIGAATHIDLKGKKTWGLSPDRLDYALSQFFTRGNVYTAASGHLYKVISGKMSEEEKSEETKRIWSETPLVRKYIRSTSPYKRERQEMEYAQEKEASRRINLERKLKDLHEGVKNRKVDEREITKFFLGLDGPDAQRMGERYGQILATDDIKDLGYWTRLRRLPTKAKATVLYYRLARMPYEKREAFISTGARTGVVSGEVYYYIMQIKRQKIAEAKAREAQND